MTVYWDMMLLINFIIDYIVLYSTSKVGFLNTNTLKLFLGALIGGIYGIFVFEQVFFINVLTFFLVTLLIIYIAFSKLDIKTVITYYIISFLFGGISNLLNNMYGVIKMSGNFFYVENNLLIIIFGVIVSSFIIVMSLKIINRNILKNKQIKTINIFFENKSVSVAGFVDTGNLLLDPITGYPVILVPLNSIKEMLPYELKEFLKEGNSLSSNINRKYLSKIRLIPCKNSSSSDILKGFKPDYIVVKDKKDKIIKDVIVAVTYKELSPNNEFNAILNPQI